MKRLVPLLFVAACLAEDASKPEPTIAEMKAEIILLRAKLAQSGIRCQVALLPEVYRVDQEVTAAQAAVDALKPKPEPAKLP